MIGLGIRDCSECFSGINHFLLAFSTGYIHYVHLHHLLLQCGALPSFYQPFCRVFARRLTSPSLSLSLASFS